MENLKIDDDFKNLLPDLTSEEYTGLERDIVKHGVLNPIIIWNGIIVDGHNRYAICQAHHIEAFQTKEISFDSKAQAIEWIINHQKNRRNLKRSQVVTAWAKYEAERAKEAEKRISPGTNQYTDRSTSNLKQTTEDKKRNPTVAAEVAKKIGVSENTYRDMKLITNEGTPEQIERMNKGGRGNGVSAIASEIKAKNKPPIKCTICGEVLPASYFQNGRKQCKNCRNVVRHPGLLTDVKGDRIYSTGEFANIPDDEVVGDLYDTKKEIQYTAKDVMEEFLTNFRNSISNLRRVLESHKEIVDQSKEELEQMWNVAEESFNKLKGEYT